MTLELRDDQQELLRELLDAAYRDLKYEAANTDLSTYKDEMRLRVGAVRELLDLVGGPLQDLPVS